MSKGASAVTVTCASSLPVRSVTLTVAVAAVSTFTGSTAAVLKPGNSGDDALKATLQQHVKDKLAPYKYPRWIEFLPELPKTATGKIQRFKLRA